MKVVRRNRESELPFRSVQDAGSRTPHTRMNLQERPAAIESVKVQFSRASALKGSEAVSRQQVRD
jgi:hypothetical protein